MQKYYYLYQITNLVNNKIYIGVHKTDNIDDEYMGSGKLLKYAIQKYGIENFKKTILLTFDSVEDMFKAEAEVVTEEFLARTDTYNIRPGGKGGWSIEEQRLGGRNGIHVLLQKEQTDPIFREKMQQTRSNTFKKLHAAKDPRMRHKSFLGKHHNAETKVKIGKANAIKMLGSGNSQYGKMWICNDFTKESITILKTAPIPTGWRKGRYCPRIKDGQTN